MYLSVAGSLFRTGAWERNHDIAHNSTYLLRPLLPSDRGYRDHREVLGFHWVLGFLARLVVPGILVDLADQDLPCHPIVLGIHLHPVNHTMNIYVFQMFSNYGSQRDPNLGCAG